MHWFKKALKAAWPTVKRFAAKVAKYAVDTAFKAIASWFWDMVTGRPRPA